MMKKAASLILAITVILGIIGAFPAMAATDIAYEVEGGNIYFNPETGTVTDCDYTVTSAVIPEKINGASVTSISCC